MVELIKGFVVNFGLSLNVNAQFIRLCNSHGLNYNKSESHLSLKVFFKVFLKVF